ncbi:hypothetical protein FQN54_006431 [Arachnomyces sp. PD_36]|nr:hypothetical protein FQN54_006431 [Arachnomyces sp. PD_36]
MLPRPISLSGPRQTFEIAHPLNRRGREFYAGRYGRTLQVEPASINSSAIPMINISNGNRFSRRSFSSTTARSAVTGVKGVSSKRARATRSVLGAPKAPPKEKDKPQNKASPYTKDGHDVYESLARVVVAKPEIKGEPDTPSQSLDGVAVEKDSHGAQVDLQNATATNDGPGSTVSTKQAIPVLDEKQPEAPISQNVAPVEDTPKTKNADKNATYQAPMPKKQDQVPKNHDPSDLTRGPASLIPDSDKRIASAKEAKAVRRKGERPEKDSEKIPQGASPVNKTRELPSLPSIRQSLYLGWEKLLKSKTQYVLLRERREELERLERIHSFKRNTDLLMENTKRRQEHKAQLSREFVPALDSLATVIGELTDIHRLHGREFCHEYAMAFEINSSKIRLDSHEWRNVVFLRSKKDAEVRGSRNGRLVYHRIGVQRLVWDSFKDSAEMLNTHLLRLLKGPQGSLRPDTHFYLKRMQKNNKRLLVEGKYYRSVTLQKSIRDFFLSKPKSSIHWKQLDLWAPFQDYLLSYNKLVSISNALIRLNLRPDEKRSRTRKSWDRRRLRDRVWEVRRDSEANIHVLIEQIFELNWLLLNLQELNSSPRGTHRTYPDFRVSKPLSENPQRFEQWVHFMVNVSSPKEKLGRPLSDQKPTKLVRRLVDRTRRY